MMQKVLKGRENKSSGEKLGRSKEDKDVKKGMTVVKSLKLGAKADRKYPDVYLYTITKVPITTTSSFRCFRGGYIWEEGRNISNITSSQRFRANSFSHTKKQS